MPAVLRDRYPPVSLLDSVPSLALRLGPQLEVLDRLLDDDELLARVRAALGRRHPRTAPAGGRPPWSR